MRWLLIVLAAGAALWVLSFGLVDKKQNQTPVFAAAPEDLVLIAHAGGGLKDGTYSNAQEAMDLAYANGIRLFELDFLRTSDGALVALHDWTHSYDYWFGVSAFDRLWRGIADRLGWPRRPLSHEAFMARPMRRGLSSMDLEAVVAWLKRHEDAYLVTDVKRDNLAGLVDIATASAGIMDRVIPQIYVADEYRPVRDLGFARIILTAYRIRQPIADVIDQVEALDLFALTMPRDRVGATTAERLRNLPFPVFTHTINDPSDAAKLRDAGVSGVYTDYLVPSEK